jgi:hypothetical protein
MHNQSNSDNRSCTAFKQTWRPWTHHNVGVGVLTVTFLMVYWKPEYTNGTQCEHELAYIEL